MNKILIWSICSFSVYIFSIFIIWMSMSPDFTPEITDLDIPFAIADLFLTILFALTWIGGTIFIDKKFTKRNNKNE